jgi:hypothetical protein
MSIQDSLATVIELKRFTKKPEKPNPEAFQIAADIFQKPHA